MMDVDFLRGDFIMTEKQFAAGAPDVGSAYKGAAEQYQIWFRSIDFDFHEERIFGLEDGGGNSPFGSWSNHEYIEIMKLDSDGNASLDTRFQGLGLKANPEHPTGFQMTPNDRLVAMVSNTAQTPVSMDPIFYDDPAWDQKKYPGQLQDIDHPGEHMLALTVNERQMLQIKLAMLNAANQINKDNPGFGLLGGAYGLKYIGFNDPNSINAAKTFRGVALETARLQGIDTSKIPEFDPGGLSPSSGDIIKTKPVELFQGSDEELREAVKAAEAENAQQLARLRKDIDADLTEPEPMSLSMPGAKP